MPASNAVQRWFEPTPDTVRAAREFAVTAVPLGRLDTDTVALVVSELASNAVLHARTPYAVAVERHRDVVTIEVTDGSRQVPTAGPRRHTTSPAEGTGGRGLQIIESVTRDWGIDLIPGDGKRTWVRVEVSTDASDPPP